MFVLVLEQIDRLNKSTTSIINTNLHSSTVLSSTNSCDSDDNIHDDEFDGKSDTVSVIERTAQNQLIKKNINSTKHSINVDKIPPQKTTTASGKKRSDEMIQQNGRGTANLRSHLLLHNLQSFAFESQVEQRVLKINRTSNNQMSLMRKHAIDKAILKCIIEGGLPFSIFNHDAVIELLNLLQPSYKPPDRHTLSSRIHDQYHQHILDLKSVLHYIGPIAFTSDLWKDVSRQHIISLSLHTFSIDFDFISLPISFHQFNEQKLAVNIQSFFEHEKVRFGFGMHILSGVTTDNGPDIKCAASSNVLGPRYACLAHCLNLVVHHATCVWDPPNPKRFPFDSMYEQVNTSLVDDEDDERTAEIMPYSWPTSMVNRECLLDSNGQQLIDYFVLDEAESDVSTEKSTSNEDVFNLLVRINRLVRKVRVFVSMTRLVAPLQHYIHEQIGPNKGGFILDVKIRWNSTFKMIHRLINLRDLVDAMFAKRDFKGLTSIQEKKFRSLVFTYDDWELINAFHDCLDIFDKATTMLSGDYPTQSMSYFVLQTLKENVQQTLNPTYYHMIINKSLNFQSEYYVDDFLPSAQKLGMKVRILLNSTFK
ncbi:unnamed protein product [Rotaria sp. Silwood1]|nr:unnamed protein product [Rotaria sp. Silwood1]CAF5016069.1 unnamed protein product [Rotaria sp. Silwood1]